MKKIVLALLMALCSVSFGNEAVDGQKLPLPGIKCKAKCDIGIICADFKSCKDQEKEIEECLAKCMNEK